MVCSASYWQLSRRAANQDQNELNEIRRQWVLAFRKTGITTMEQVNAGMRVTRQQRIIDHSCHHPGSLLPGAGKKHPVTAGLPNASELVDMVLRYLPETWPVSDAESYPWKSNALLAGYQLQYQNMQTNALTDAELRRKAADEPETPV